MTAIPDNNHLSVIGKQFPNSQENIQKFYHEDEDFRELCRDYGDCLDVIERLRQENDTFDPRMEEYCEERVNLEQELLIWLSTKPKQETRSI